MNLSGRVGKLLSVKNDSCYGLSGLGPETRNAALVDRQMQRCGCETQNDTEIPDEAIRSGLVIDNAAQPDADERPELVAEESDAVEHAHIARPEEQGNEARRQRHGREPQQTHCCRERIGSDFRNRDQQERRDRNRAEEVDGREQDLFWGGATPTSLTAASRRC